MLFQPGHQMWKLRKHTYKGGRLTKEQLLALSGLVPKSIEVWKTILEMKINSNGKGLSVQADVASKVLNKFVADLSEINEEHGIDDGFAKLLTDIASRVGGKSSNTTSGKSDNSEQSSMPT